MKRIAVVALVAATLGCDNPPLVVVLRTLSVEVDASGSGFGASISCEMTIQIRAVGGGSDHAAVFEGGRWSASRGSSPFDEGPITVPWFTDVYGADRVRSGNSLTGASHHRLFLTRTGFYFEVILRFRMPDGALRSEVLLVHCIP